MSEPVLPIVVIYRNPLDHPGRYVTRRQWACRDGEVLVEEEPLAVVDTLDQARAAVPLQTDTCLPRMAGDDPCIVETWL